MKKIILISLLLCCIENSFTQEGNTNLQTYIENIIEGMTDSENSNADIESLVADLEYLQNNPININHATEMDLQKLWILNDFQIKSLLDYRKRAGKIVSFAELGYLYGFTYETVNLIRPFIFIGEKEYTDSLQIKKFIKKSKYELIGRSNFSPSNNVDNKSYTASTYFRFLGKYRNIIRFGLIAENDAGERYNLTPKQKGFDFYSAHLAFKINKAIPSLIIGDYRVKSGQGLLTWNGFGSGKSVEILAMQKRGQGIRPNSSKNEFNFFRGIAVTTKLAPLTLHWFASIKYLDASIDTLNNMQGARTIFSTGYHIEPLDISRKKNLKESTVGSRIGFRSSRTVLGMNLLSIQYSSPLLPSEYPHQQYSFTGDHYLGISTDYKLMLESMQFFGETAYNGSGFASINGINLLVSENLSTTVFRRDLAPQYNSPYSSAIAENSSMNNEKGTFIGMNWTTNWGINLSAYSDVFSFPWLSYNANGPLKGTDYMAQLTYLPLADLKFLIRYKRKTKDKNLSHVDLTTKILHPFIREAFRLHLHYKVSDRLSMSNRYEWCQSGYRGIKYNAGYLLYQDVRFQLRNNVSLFLRYAWFDVKDYYSRIYAYENDVLYAHSMPPFYGCGQKLYLIVRYCFNRKITLWIKYSYGNYFRNEQFKGQNIKIQFRYKF